jgi:hypothetical protein
VAPRSGRTPQLVGVAALLGATVALGAVALLVTKTSPGQRAQAATADRRLVSAPAGSSPAAARRFPLHGHILDADGNAVEGARVRVLTPERAPNVLSETTTDHGGGFAFERMASPRVRVEAERDPQGAVRSAEMIVADESSIELTLVLVAAAVSGVVVDDDDGHPVAGATLSIEGVSWPVPGATSDASGQFRFSLVPFEARSIVAVASGYRTAQVLLGPREDRPEPVLRFALRRGEPTDGQVLDPEGKPLHAQVVACEGQPSEARVESGDDGTFRLPPSTTGCSAIALHEDMAPSDPVLVEDGARITLRLGAGGAIAGSVVDERGAPVDSFTVGVESIAAPHGVLPHVKPGTFQRGSFRLERLVPGSYVLMASTQGRPPARSDPIDVRRAAVTDGVRIVIAAGGIVVGRVVDDRNTPLAGVDLRFDLVSAVTGSDASARTDDSGRYRLEGAPRGPFTLRAQKDGLRTKLLSGLFIESGRTLTQDITMSPFDGGPGTEFGGIGANLQTSGNAIVFAGVFPGQPADRAGVRQGDRLVRVDGEDAAGMSQVDAIQRLRGEPGTSVGVSVQRGGAVLDLVIVRASIVH